MFSFVESSFAIDMNFLIIMRINRCIQTQLEKVERLWRWKGWPNLKIVREVFVDSPGYKAKHRLGTFEEREAEKK